MDKYEKVSFPIKERPGGRCVYKVVPQKFCAVGLNPPSGLNQGLKTLAEILPLDKALNSQLFFYSLTRTSILSHIIMLLILSQVSILTNKLVQSKEGQHFVLCQPNYWL